MKFSDPFTIDTNYEGSDTVWDRNESMGAWEGVLGQGLLHLLALLMMLLQRSLLELYLG